MHLTSDVYGRIGGDRGTDELIRATFPAGTMTGTPKVRAMEIIDQLEPPGAGCTPVPSARSDCPMWTSI